MPGLSSGAGEIARRGQWTKAQFIPVINKEQLRIFADQNRNRTSHSQTRISRITTEFHGFISGFISDHL
jgi:hypothetical protein